MAQKIINNDRNASLTIVDILSLLIFSDDRANLKFKSKTMAKTDFKVFKNIGIFLYIYVLQILPSPFCQDFGVSISLSISSSI